jgi:hypothetical protein
MKKWQPINNLHLTFQIKKNLQLYAAMSYVE